MESKSRAVSTTVRRPLDRDILTIEDASDHPVERRRDDHVTVPGGVL